VSNRGNAVVESVVKPLVISMTFNFSKQLLQYTKANNEGCGYEDDPGLVGLNLLETLENARYHVEDIDDLGELEEQGDGYKVPPGVAR
jgi:hypothetical protein